MLGLPKDLDKRVAQIVRGQHEAQRTALRPRVMRSRLTPTMVGTMMILVPRREDGSRADWPETIPPFES